MDTKQIAEDTVEFLQGRLPDGWVVHSFKTVMKNGLPPGVTMGADRNYYCGNAVVKGVVYGMQIRIEAEEATSEKLVEQLLARIEEFNVSEFDFALSLLDKPRKLSTEQLRFLRRVLRQQKQATEMVLDSLKRIGGMA